MQLAIQPLSAQEVAPVLVAQCEGSVWYLFSEFLHSLSMPVFFSFSVSFASSLIEALSWYFHPEQFTANKELSH